MIVAPKKAGAYNVLLTDGYTKNVLIEAAGNRVDLIEGRADPASSAITFSIREWSRPRAGPEFPEPPAREFARSSSFRAERLRTLLKQTPPINWAWPI